jgi:hypothetical protein
MTRRKLIWSVVVALPLAIGAAWAGWQATANAANSQAGTQAVDCCYDPACPSGCSPECPPDCCPPCPFCP